MKRRTFLLGAGAVGLVGGGLAVWQRQRGLVRYHDYAALLRRPLAPEGGVAELVRAASLAPNGHNTQSWHFQSTGHSLALTPDFSRRTPVVDPDNHHLFVSLGGAAENLIIAGTALGMPGEMTAMDDGSLRYDWAPGPITPSPLANAILSRQSTRAKYDGKPVENAILRQLEAAARQDGVRVVMVTARPTLNAVRDLVVAGNDLQMADAAFIEELKHWLRFSPESAITHGDGLYAPASGNPSLPDVLGPIAFDLAVTKKSEADKYAAQLDSSAGVAVFFGERADRRHWGNVGRAQERFLLEATRQNLRCAYVNQPVEVASLRPALAALLGEKGLRPDLVIRFGRAATLPYSPRRTVSAIATL